MPHADVDGEADHRRGERLGEGRRQAGSDLGGHDVGAGLATVGLDEDRQHVALDTGRDVDIADARAEPGGSGGDELVGGALPVPVEHRADPAEADDEDGDGVGRPPAPAEGPLDLVVEDVAADEAGEDVVRQGRGIGQPSELVVVLPVHAHPAPTPDPTSLSHHFITISGVRP